MTKYAENTSVSLDTSVAEIRRTIGKYGATRFGYLHDQHAVMIAFEMRDRRIRFSVPLPDPRAREFTHTAVKGWQREPEQVQAAYEQAVKQKFRALLLTIKAKLESVEAGIETFEEAFMATIVMPDGSTVGEWAEPQVRQMYLSGKMPPLIRAGD